MNRAKKERLSIFNRLLIAFLGAVIIVSGLLTVVFYTFSKNSIEKQTQERISQQFATLSHAFEDTIKNAVMKEMKILASNPVIDNFMMSSYIEKEINARAIERLFKQSINYTKSYESISFVDVLGKEIIKIDRAGRRKDYRDFGRTELFTYIESAASGSIHSNSTYNDADGSTFFSIGIHKTDADIGEFGGALIIDYNLKGFFEYLNTIKIFDQNPVWVFNPDGKVLKQPPENGVLFDPRPYLSNKVREAPFSLISNQGMVIYQDLSLVPDKPLIRMAISVPSSLLLKDTWQIFRFYSIVLIVSLLVTFVAAYSLSKYLSKPIIKLAKATVRLAGGDLSTRVDVHSGDEIGGLAESFNHMADKLQTTYENMAEKNRQLLDAQEELVRKEKLSVLGELSGSVGHELRNPLGVISNAVYYLQTVNQDADETTKEYLGIIKDEVGTSQRIISDLLEFARTKTPNVHSVSVGELVAESLGKCSIPEVVKIQMNLPNTLPVLKVDTLQMKQVFINLIMNAVQAMPEGGTLEINAEEASSREEIQVSFTDHGEGISPENMEKLFQPLFTTKARGIGLGLTASQNLTKANGGIIEVNSKEGKWTTFTVILPTERART